MRGRKGGEQHLSEEQGPLSEHPFPPKNAPRDGGRWKKFWKKKNLLSILSKDRFFFCSERKADREAGCSLDWRRERLEGGRAGCFKHKRRWKKSFGRMDSVMETHIKLTARTQSNKHKPAALHIDLFHQIVSRKMWFCAWVNKYFRYIMLSYPSPFHFNRLVHDLHITWLTVAALRCNPINAGPKFKTEKWYMTVFMLCYPCTFLFHSLSLALSLFPSNFLQDLENVLASLHAALLNQPPLTSLSLLHHRLLWSPLIFLIS